MPLPKANRRRGPMPPLPQFLRRASDEENSGRGESVASTTAGAGAGAGAGAVSEERRGAAGCRRSCGDGDDVELSTAGVVTPRPLVAATSTNLQHAGIFVGPSARRQGQQPESSSDTDNRTPRIGDGDSGGGGNPTPTEGMPLRVIGGRRPKLTHQASTSLSSGRSGNESDDSSTGSAMVTPRDRNNRTRSIVASCCEDFDE